MKVKLDVALPVVVVPLGLMLATIHAYVTALVLVSLPVAILGFYQLWLRRPIKSRTQVFYAWGLTSVVQMYATFEFVVVGFREILLWENLLLSTLFGLSMYAFYCCKRGPGVVARTQSQDFRQMHDEALAKLSSNERSTEEEEKAEEEGGAALDPVGQMLVDNFGMDKQALIEETEEEKEEAKGHIINAHSVHWVDSRMTQDGRVRTWCRWCRVNKPPRAGHCPICNVCVPGRDHHCVWIDCCIGAGNHRAFLLAVILVLLTGCYGVHLTLTTICTPVMLYDWFLWPNDCRFAYTDFPTALSYVSACYSMIGLAVMAVTLASQCVLVSQNVTSHELHTAGWKGWVHYGFHARNNTNNRGSVRNWLDFWMGRRKRNAKYLTVTV